MEVHIHDWIFFPKTTHTLSRFDLVSGQLFGCHLEHPWLGEARVLPPFRRKGAPSGAAVLSLLQNVPASVLHGSSPRYHDPTSFVTWPRRVLGSKECGKIQTVRASPFWETRQGARAPIWSCLFTVDWGHSSWPTMSGALQLLSPGSLGSVGLEHSTTVLYIQVSTFCTAIF